jgi:hypothetical protein
VTSPSCDYADLHLRVQIIAEKIKQLKKESAHFMFLVNSQIKQILKHIWINSYKYLEPSGTYISSLMIFSTYHGFLEIHICRQVINGHISGQVTNFVSTIYSISISLRMNGIVLFSLFIATSIVLLLDYSSVAIDGLQSTLGQHGF